MRIDPLPKLTPVAITQQPNGYAATLVNVKHPDTHSPITSAVHPTVTGAIKDAQVLARVFGYEVV